MKPETSKILRIGTRGSKLALTQTNMVAMALREHHPSLKTEIVEIKTSGDWQPEQGETRLSEEDGGKGLFAREIEKALLEGAIDCAVHSIKDMSSFLPDGLVIDHILPREDPRDAFLANDYETLEDLPAGATVGTSSLRRQAQLLIKRPDVKVVPLRGNVPTRIEKLRSWKVDAIILAMAGLNRLGLEKEVASVIEPEDMLPAAGQGAVGIETRADDEKTRQLLGGVHHSETGWCVAAERAALQILDGSCHTPIGAYAIFERGVLSLRVLVAAPDGKQLFKEQKKKALSSVAEARGLGRQVGESLKKSVPEGLLGV